MNKQQRAYKPFYQKANETPIESEEKSIYDKNHFFQ